MSYLPVLEDASFIVALIDNKDSNHARAWKVFEFCLKNNNKIKIFIPSIAFLETTAVLIRKKINTSQVNNSLWKFLHIDNIINIPLIETMAFKLCRKYAAILQDETLKNNGFPSFIKTSDFYIATSGIEYEAKILTFDAKMCKRIRPSKDFE